MKRIQIHLRVVVVVLRSLTHMDSGLTANPHGRGRRVTKRCRDQTRAGEQQ